MSATRYHGVANWPEGVPKSRQFSTSDLGTSQDNGVKAIAFEYFRAFSRFLEKSVEKMKI